MKHIQLLLLIVISLLGLSLSVGCSKNEKEVIIYTSVDRVYSEQVFNQFTKETGIKVLPVYDVEATKTTGLAQRIIAERKNPVADVFWNGEIIYTVLLAQEDVLQPYVPKSLKESIEKSLTKDNHLVGKDSLWIGFGGRARVFIINKDNVKIEDYPNGLGDLAMASTYYSIGLAKPLAGTTATHVAALYSVLGPDEAKRLFTQIQDSKVHIVDGNGAVRDLVVSGQLDYGLTDTDDALGALEKGANVALVFPDQGADQPGTLVIPNSVALIKHGKHSELGQQFIDFLLELSTQQLLIDIGWCQLSQTDTLLVSEGLKPFIPNSGKIKTIDVDFEMIIEKLELSKEDMTHLFLN